LIAFLNRCANASRRRWRANWWISASISKNQARVDELARKCNEGAMSPAEQAEYEAIIEEADLIALLQAKARAFLADAES